MKKNPALVVFVFGMIALLLALSVYALYMLSNHKEDQSTLGKADNSLFTLGTGARSSEDELLAMTHTPLPVNEPKFELSERLSVESEVEYKELELLAGYIKYETNFESNYAIFLDKAEDYMQSAVTLPERLSSRNLDITNLAHNGQTFIVIDSPINSESVLFSVHRQASGLNRVDRVCVIKGAQYSSFKYLTSGRIVFSHRQGTNFLLTLIGEYNGDPVALSCLLLGSPVYLGNDDTDNMTLGGEPFELVDSDMRLCIKDTKGEIIWEGTMNEAD